MASSDGENAVADVRLDPLMMMYGNELRAFLS